MITARENRLDVTWTKPLSLHLYTLATFTAAPLAPGWLAARARRGKEETSRLGEKLGRASRPRPDGALFWMHGASVGEGLSLLPLVADVMIQRPEATVLVTTGTRASADMLAARLPPGVIHQFAPLDTPGAVAGFLRHWRPDLAVFVESELWPNLILGARAAGARMALVSARLSNASFQNWRRAPRAAKALLDAFELILPRDDASAMNFRALGAEPDGLVDLKSGAPPLPVDDAEVSRLAGQLRRRPVLLAASTHPGEEELILGRFAVLACQGVRPLLILAPRHPDRGPAIEALARTAGFSVARRAAGQDPRDADLFIADTLGELGLWYRLCSLALIGGSLVRGVGGHNPLEPARLDCPFISGVHVENWPVYAELQVADATRCVTVDALDDYFQKAVVDHPALATMAKRARAFVDGRDQENLTVAGRLVGMLTP